MSRKAYFIQDTVTDANGEYIPCIAVENVRGFYRTNWTWGKNRKQAQLIADRMNERLGISRKDAYTIVLDSMRR